MENLGQYLRSHREGRHLSQEELAVRTRVPLRHIRSMEDNQFENLPHAVSARGFLRVYARHVGLDEALVLKRFSEVYVPPTPSPIVTRLGEGAPPHAPTYIHVTHADRFSWVRIVLIAGGVILVILVVGLKMADYFDPILGTAPPVVVTPPAPAFTAEVPSAMAPEIAQDAAQEPSGSTLDVDAVIPSHPERSGLDGLEASQTEGLPQRMRPADAPPVAVAIPSAPQASGAATQTGEKSLVLAIEAKEATWVRVVVDGKETWDVLLKPQEKLEWQAEGEFLLTVGNAGGVQVRFDGKDLGALGPRGKVVRDLRLARKVSGHASSLSAARMS